jgi:pyruvate kinase
LASVGWIAWQEVKEASLRSRARRTKIVATLGPASDTPQVMDALLDAGMDVARFGLAHGTPEGHVARIAEMRARAERRGRTVGILADLPGPKVRAGEFPEGGVFLAEGDDLTIVTGNGPSDARQITCDEAMLTEVVSAGDTIVLGDGTVTLEAKEVLKGLVRAEVRSGGRLMGRPGCHLPSDRWQPPVPTDQDLELIDKVAHEADWVAVSFVRRADELVKVREALGDDGPRLIAKVETRAAVDHLDELLAVADGVMVARGDYGVEAGVARVPLMQKETIYRATQAGKAVITATQMLESMMTNPIPTRAEASDVANAIYDGSDAVMLSGETASGEFPIEAVRMMAAIIKEAEAHIEEWGRWHGANESTSDDSVALARAARELAHDRDVSAIAIFTLTGRNARIISKARPHVPILAFTPDSKTYQRLPIFWGVTPYLIPQADTVEAMLAHVEAGMLYDSPVRPGQQVIVIAGLPPSRLVPANFILLHTVGKS